jgi:hypothetical protein
LSCAKALCATNSGKADASKLACNKLRRFIGSPKNKKMFDFNGQADA